MGVKGETMTTFEQCMLPAVFSRVCEALAGDNRSLGAFVKTCRATAQHQYREEARRWRHTSLHAHGWSEQKVQKRADAHLVTVYNSNATRVSVQPHVRHLKVFSSPIQDVSLLGTLHTLTLISCPLLSDVSCLVTVYSLSLMSCPLVSDVSRLGTGTVHSLRVVDCPVVDVSPLGNIHTLYLGGCSLVEDVSALGTVHTPTLSDCPLVSDVSRLSTVQCLLIANCPSVVDVSALEGIYSFFFPGFGIGCGIVHLFGP